MAAQETNTLLEQEETGSSVDTSQVLSSRSLKRLEATQEAVFQKRSPSYRVSVAAGFGVILLGLLAAFMIAAASGAVLPRQAHDSATVATTLPPVVASMVREPEVAVYAIKHALSNFYLEVEYVVGDHSNGEAVRLGYNPMSRNSRWFLTPSTSPDVFDIQLDSDRTYSMTYAATATGGAGQSIVQIQDNPAIDASQWQFINIGSSNNYLIKNARERLYVGADGDTIGSNVEVNSVPTAARNQWRLELASRERTTPGPTPEGTSLAHPAVCSYNIRSPTTKLVLNVAGASRSKEALVDLSADPVESSSSPFHRSCQWTFNAVEDGVYTIQNVNAPDQYLNLRGGGRPPEYESSLQLYNNPGSPDSQFAFYKLSSSGQLSNDEYLIRNIATRKYLTASEQTSGFGVLLDIASDTPAARWELQCVALYK